MYSTVAHVYTILAMSLHGKTALLCLCHIFVLVFADEGCDKSQCKGPVTFYESLKCKPVYAEASDCCPTRYDCSHLEGRSADKCYANGRAYSIGEDLKDEDSDNPCDVGCSCVKHDDNPASFSCAIQDCFEGAPIDDGCYWKQELGSCCGTGEIYCPKKGEEKVTCEVNGTIYHDGEGFYPKERNLPCVCMEGFKGEFVEPFCRRTSCGSNWRTADYFNDKCAPVYYHDESSTTDCKIYFRCPKHEDTVIKAAAVKVPAETSAEMKCSFGNMTMEVGDELNQTIISYNSECVKCVCEVPPTPTCRQLSENECSEVTKHLDVN